ncbi:RhoGEF domain containing protein [Trichomonas vaginalis G3]|uniref:RhoGEF domain containing protein n=1 Tax=Trichomonas vaginalis (strain ATCC PRA-98 / G3) TaxID=412133 RepID=A2F4F7_TRIV3|nr:guanyl-nucleotide exchange factor protein [Trichomonas vaginalis G3]EAY00222.1 RhoGEF domain containing protein [Trichomonas vaginalis G3]KAI5492888.1 guanyl-nucleotide exchange factor protein [Trichomonas vaginalis G3]|eukprot:XP_001313151.1 RhoGEF domain containing protein [Trichomonas vaginalis G3]
MKPTVRPLNLFLSEARAYKIIKTALIPLIKAQRENKDSKRRSIFLELITTERNFVEGLNSLDDIYYRPLNQSINSKKPLIDAGSLTSLFGNIDQIRDAHENGILKAMDEVLPDLKKPFPPKEKYIYLATKILEIYPRMSTLYRSYLQTNDGSEALLDKCNKNKAFREFMSQCLFNPRAKCRSIEDFLILPVQRIAGYRCLYERILKYFPESMEEEHRIYKDVLDKVVALGATMNKEKINEKDQEALLNIAECVTKKPTFLAIMKPGRKLLGQVSTKYLDQQTGKVNNEGSIHVFTDILLLSTSTISGIFGTMKSLYVDAIPIQQIRFQATIFNDYAEKAFVLRTDTHEYNLMLKTTKKRDEFIHFVKKQKKKISSRVKEQSKNGQTHMQSLLNELADLYSNPQQMRTRSQALNAL